MISESNPVFVKIDKYKEIMDIIEVIDKKVSGVKEILAEIDELRAKEDQDIKVWEKNVEEITAKISSIKDNFTL